MVVSEYSSAHHLSSKQIPRPQPGPGEICISIKVAGVSFVDGLSIAGQYQVRHALPFIPGTELAGVIDAMGSNVDGWQIGDRVCAATPLGAFAEAICVDALFAKRVPENVPLVAAACMRVTHATALHALKQKACLSPGETVLVLGAGGGVGFAAVQIAKTLGAQVIAAASSEERQALARQGGADWVVNSRNPDLRNELNSIVGKRGIDVIVDTTGGVNSEMAFRTLAPNGRHLVIGFASGSVPTLPLNLPLLKCASLVGVNIGMFERSDPLQAQLNMEQLFDWYLEGKLQLPVASTLPLADAQKAVELVMSASVAGRVVLGMTGET